MKPRLSLIVPTYNESANLEELARRMDAALRQAQISYECLVMDDVSPDGTFDLARRLAERYPLRPVLRAGPKGLGAAVIEGFALAQGEILGVMDADLQHPPELLPTGFDFLLRENLDVAVASRYVPGGGVEGWPKSRLLISRVGGLLARPLTQVKDCTSGFFFLKRSVIEGVDLRPLGYKVLLEVLVRGKCARAGEFPYVFRERRAGVSKIGPRIYKEYLLHLAALYKAKFLG